MTHKEILNVIKLMQEQANEKYNDEKHMQQEWAQRWNELKITEKIIKEILDNNTEID